MHSARMLSSGLRAFNSALPRTALSQPKSRHFSQLLSHTPQPSQTPSSRLLRTKFPQLAVRNNSSSSSSRPNLTDQTPNAAQDAANEEQNRLRRDQEPAYQITFTCKPCGHRSSHRMSKHGYHRGTILIRCPSCLNRHVIADHLNIFMDKKSTLEDILQREGKRLTRGYVDGDMEFWEDGTVKKREEAGEGSEAKSDQGSTP
ncbi:uncharacterized protein C24H6.02c [Aspergillus udagawae]|uniref:Uncharacterized protein C24H6.02c n=1 Tax=Aspergillus udagawae TaxID=91492 RepID=A0ABQ1A2G9_9EURO|nr:uncharacterized protein C24H6.02c [Aspergillus udagawae]GFF71981.1 uncharacterized protein C24H6.02c [Aspergillus udagawae]GFG18319.1 uncharacterized protein C24H6.02c [Aspergillus udagawae]GFG21614.1 uncharacterized protein C24H6.02c [Aspergillus udagawae]